MSASTTTSRFRNRSTAWSPADDDELRRMAGEGLKDHEIAAALGRTPSAIQQRRSKLGIVIGNPGRGGRPANPLPGPLSSGQLREIQNQLDRGLSAAEIAAVMNLPERAVRAAIDNQHLVAAPRRTVYHPPAGHPWRKITITHANPAAAEPVGSPDPEPAPAAELCVMCDREPQMPGRLLCELCADRGEGTPERQFADGELLSRIPDGPSPMMIDCMICGDPTSNESQVCNACSDAAELAEREAGFDASLDAVDTSPATVDDWEEYTRVPQITGMVVVLRRGSTIAMSPEAWQALGEPEHVALLWSRTRQAIGIRPSTSSRGARVIADGRMREVRAAAFAKRFDLTFAGLRLPATVENGVLVVEVDRAVPA